MTDESGLVFACVLNGDGSGKRVGWPEIDSWTADQGLLWVHLDSNSQDAITWLETRSGIGELTRESLLEQDTRPRHTMTDDGLLLILRGVNMNPGDDPDDMVAIRMLFSEHRIITLRYRRIMAIQNIIADLMQKKGPRSVGDFLVLAADRIADRIGDVIADLDDQVDALEDSMLTAENAALRTQSSSIRRKTIGLRRYIAPQRDVLMRLLHERNPWISDRERAHLRETAERTARFVDDVDAARDRAALTQEELRNRLSEQMNRAMYILSIVAGIFLPLGLLTGLLGINVGGIPGTENKWAFTLVTAALVAIAVGLVAWFKKLDWL
jgi:zinc transporter